MTEKKRAYASLLDFPVDWPAPPPGETIAELLEEKGWTQVEFAKRMGFSTKHVNLLIKGKASITAETALKLERVLGSTSRFWMNLETQYREFVARRESLENLKREEVWLKELCLPKEIRYGALKKSKSPAEQIEQLLHAYSVASVSAFKNVYPQLASSPQPGSPVRKKRRSA